MVLKRKAEMEKQKTELIRRRIEEKKDKLSKFIQNRTNEESKGGGAFRKRTDEASRNDSQLSREPSTSMRALNMPLIINDIGYFTQGNNTITPQMQKSKK